MAKGRVAGAIMVLERAPRPWRDDAERLADRVKEWMANGCFQGDLEPRPDLERLAAEAEAEAEAAASR